MSRSEIVGVGGDLVEDRVVPPGQFWARLLRRGQMLRIIDLEGRQAVDFLCYNAADPDERYNAADTMKYAKTIFLTRGHGIYSNLGRRLFTIVEDTCGRHDTIGGCCSAESNEFRYGVKNTPSCRANFLRALAGFGLGAERHRGQPQLLHECAGGPRRHHGDRGRASPKPGDYVDLRAETDILTAISNCPQVHNPATALQPTTPIRLIVTE